MTRIVSAPELEAELVELALVATAAQLDSLAAGCSLVARNNDPDAEARNHDNRSWSLLLDDDGTGTITVHGPTDLLCEMLTAVDTAEKRETANDGECLEARRFDAALTIARQHLRPDPEAAPATTIVIRAEAAPPADTTNEPEPDPAVPIRAHGLPISRAAYERLRCDAAIAVERALDDGTVERSPTKEAIPRRVRRAVRARDLSACRWPGCTSRASIQVHHIVWRSRYGLNAVGNLVSLCHYHHRSVHHRGWRIDGDANGKLFTDRTGRVANERTDRRRALHRGALMRAQADRGFTPDPFTIATALGDRLDREWAVGTICHNDEIYAQRN